MAVRLQPLVRHRLAWLGDAGSAWEAALPAIVDDLCTRWSVTLVQGMRSLPGGTASFVVPVTAADGAELVLKVCVPDPHLRDKAAAEARTLLAADGVGYVRCRGHDAARGALLLERLGPALSRSGFDPPRQVEVLVEVLREAWRVPLDAVPEPAEPVAAVLHDLVGRLSRELDHRCAPGVVDQALRYADRRLAAAHDVVVVHGDAHPDNALRRAGGGWALVDPEGFGEDPAYDVGVALRDFSGTLSAGDAPGLLRDWCVRAAVRAGLHPQAVWEWAFLERVSTGLHVLELGSEPVARPFLDVAGRLLD